jgi:hypothetical protein
LEKVPNEGYNLAMSKNKDHLSNQFYNILGGSGSFSDAELDHEDSDYLMSFVECDYCNNDVHMDDAIRVKPERYSDGTQTSDLGDHVTNYYCGEDCKDRHQSGPRKGKIGNGL